MLETWQTLFEFRTFIPHGHCYLWKPQLVWLHVFSDFLIALAYYCIPLLLIYIVRKRGDIPFDGIFWLFGSFIIACGTGHLIDILTLWYPAYWLAGLIKALTAGISVGTGVVLVSLIPKILNLPSPAQLEAANKALQKEILERNHVEAQLRTVHQQLMFHIENSPLAVVEWNNEFRVQRWSKQAEKMFGWTAEEVLARHPSEWQLIFADDVEAVNNTMKRLMDGSRARNITRNRNYTKNGSFIHCEWYNSALFDESGQLVSILSLILDVTERVLAEEALQESEIRFRATFEQAAVGIVHAAPDGSFLRVNQKFCDIVGYPREEILGRKFQEITHPEDLGTYLKGVRQMLTNEIQTYSIEKRYIRRDSSAVWANLTTSLVREQGDSIQKLESSYKLENWQTCNLEHSVQHSNLSTLESTHSLGAPKYIIGVLEEITQRKRVEEDLRTSEAELRALFGAMRDVIVVLDGEGRYVKIAPTNPSLSYKPKPEWLGKTVYDVFDSSLADKFLTDIQLVLNTQQPVNFEYSWQIENQEVWFSSSISPILEDSVMFVSRDITERKRAEESLRMQQKFLRDVIDTTPNLIFVKNEEGKFVLCNQPVAEIYGTSVENLIGKSDADFNPNLDEVEKFVSADREVILKGQEKFIPEEKVTDSTGHVRWFQTIKKPLTVQLGQTHQLLGVAMDITERKRMEEALRDSEATLRKQTQQLERTLQELKCTQAQLIQSEKMSSLGQLVAGVAHEINNPVNFIYGNLVHTSEYTQELLHILELYQRYYPQPAEEIALEIEETDLEFLVQDLPKMIFSMKLGADRIRQIVLSLRNFSRLDEAEVKAVDIHEGIDSTLLILQNRLKETGGHPAIQVIKEYTNLPLVECYAGQLNQVFMNILANAIDALDEYNKKRSPEAIQQHPSTILIRTEVQGGNQVAIRIIDNGPGMSEETRHRLFDPFFTTKAVGAGTGLGLSISYQIVVEKHRGQLKCHSTPGQGAEFVIEIPICQQNET